MHQPEPQSLMYPTLLHDKKLAETMRTHLIDLQTFGIWDDDFDTFFKNRCDWISRELATRVIRHSIDARVQPVDLSDVEEVAV